MKAMKAMKAWRNAVTPICDHPVWLFYCKPCKAWHPPKQGVCVGLPTHSAMHIGIQHPATEKTMQVMKKQLAMKAAVPATVKAMEVKKIATMKRRAMKAAAPATMKVMKVKKIMATMKHCAMKAAAPAAPKAMKPMHWVLHQSPSNNFGCAVSQQQLWM